MPSATKYAPALDGRGKGRVINFFLHPHLASPIKGEELNYLEFLYIKLGCLWQRLLSPLWKEGLGAILFGTVFEGVIRWYK